jgi:hypothetical protein
MTTPELAVDAGSLAEVPLRAEELRVMLDAVAGPDACVRSAVLSAYTTSFPIHEVVVADGAEHHRVVVKDLRWGSLSDTARLVKQAHEHDPARELGTYRHLLDATWGTARFHAGTWDPAHGTAWMAIEHVQGRELYQWDRGGAWVAAVRWLAGHHRRWSDRAELRRAASSVPLLRHDRARLEGLATAASAALGDSAEQVGGAWADAAALLGRQPRTLVHGECYASNVLVGDNDRVAVIDWETTAIGTGWSDLASLVAGWDRAHRQELLEEYLRAGAPIEPGADPEAVLDAARLQLCLQWLGSHDDWTAPDEHRHDWYSEAVGIVAAGHGSDPAEARGARS